MSAPATSEAYSHPHDRRGAIPDRLPIGDVRALSRLSPARAVGALAAEWLSIAGAVWLCDRYFHPALYVLAVMFIGARQHALAVLGHDAAHFRLLPGRVLNDAVGNLLCFWPVFGFLEGFRRFHAKHHQDPAGEGDGNRTLWRTHDADGNLVPEWVYPKTAGAMARVVLRRACLLTGARWILRGFIGPFVLRLPPAQIAAQLAFHAAAATVVTLAGAWKGVLLYWIVPFCTWHIAIQFVRLICEHSAVVSASPEYRVTRTTLPTLLESLFVLPRNVGYHIEHHDYPSVPFYRLPALHARLMREPGFAAHANVQRSLWRSIRECARGG